MALSGDAAIENHDDTIEAIFDQALSINDPIARESYLEEACGGDQHLQQDVESLLGAYDRKEDFLEAGVNAGAARKCIPIREGPGCTIGRYKLLERIGEGGFGVVYMAEQQVPFRRRVALKIIKIGMDTQQVIGRFEAERQALALMDHVNIAKVFDAGATETGRPYFVMELVKGTLITEFCDSTNLTLPDRLELFGQVCDAVQHAHQKGIIHRDIKPSNVLVAPYDGRPVPKVIDFGIAKATVHRLTERTVFTEMRQLIGTPAYMSPEQATLNNLDIDTRSDVYSLGALLYELLTGTAPFDDKQLRSLAYDELCRVIREDVPPTPSQRAITVAQTTQSSALSVRLSTAAASSPSRLRGDIDWIVMKALEKDRRRRYESASSLAADVRRYLDGKPVSAVRPSRIYRARKFVARHRALTFSVASVVLAIALGATAAIVGLVQARIAGAQLKDQLVANHNLLYQSDMSAAMQAWYDGRTDVVEHLLHQHEGEPIGPDLRGFEWYYLRDQIRHTRNVPTIQLKKPGIRPLNFDPKDRVTLVDGGSLIVWQPDSGQLSTLAEHTDFMLSVDRLAGGSLVAFGGADGTIGIHDTQTGTTKLLRPPSPAKEDRLRDVVDLEFTSSGSKLVSLSQGENELKVWNVATGEAHGPIDLGVDKRVNYFRFSPDEAFVAAAWGEQFRPALWDLNQQELFSIDELRDGVRAMAISRNNLLAAGTDDGSISLFDLEKRIFIGHLGSHSMPVTSLAFSQDGRQLVSGGYDSVVRLWDLASRAGLGMFRGHSGGIADVRFSSDGKRIASLGRDGGVNIWKVGQADRQLFASHNAAMAGVGFIESGDVVYSLSMDGVVKLTDVRSRRSISSGQLLDGQVEGNAVEVYPASAAPDGGTILAGYGEGNLVLWDLSTHTALKRFKMHTAEVWWPAFSPDGLRCATASWDQTVRLWEVSSGRELRKLATHAAPFEGSAFSPDGHFVAAANFADGVYVWSLPEDEQFCLGPSDYNGRAYRVVFSPDGKKLAACGTDSRIVLWDLSNGVADALDQGPHYLSGHAGGVLDLAFTRDSQLLASAGINVVLLWEVSTGKRRATFRDHERRVTCVAFSADGTRLVSGDADGKVIMREAPAAVEFPHLGK